MSLFVRAIRAEELGVFSRFAAGRDRGFAPEGVEAFEGWLGELWRRGKSLPECCFVCERAGEVVGAVVYWVRGNGAHVEHVRYPAGEPGVLAYLLEESGGRMRGRGVGRVWVEVAVPPMGEGEAAGLRGVLPGCGFGVGRARMTYLWKPEYGAVAGVPGRLVFRSFEEVGEEAFVAAVAEMTAGSLDAGIAAERAAKGARRYAEEELAEQGMARHEKGWWEVGYDAAGEAVGVVLAGVVGRQPAVLLLAVRPECRGEGYARELLVRGVGTLKPLWAAGGGEVKGSVRGDVDVGNVGMVRAFEGAGFRGVRRCWEYERG